MVTDEPLLTPAVLLNVPETIVVTDEPKLTTSVMLNVAEAIVVTDTATLTPSVMLNVAESIVVADAASFPDTTPPTVTINQAAGQADPASGSPIEFSVMFSEPVTGLWRKRRLVRRLDGGWNPHRRRDGRRRELHRLGVGNERRGHGRGLDPGGRGRRCRRQPQRGLHECRQHGDPAGRDHDEPRLFAQSVADHGAADLHGDGRLRAGRAPDGPGRVPE